MTRKIMPPVEKLIKKLNNLNNNPYQKIKSNVSEMLDIVYELGAAKIEFTKDEQSIIGSLIEDIIEPINTCIFNIGFDFEHNHAVSGLKLRSGLQFMLDNFKDFF